MMSGDDPEESGVGYKKPPIGTRFKKGESGNPRGRPKKRTSIPDVLMNEFSKIIKIVEGGKEIKTTQGEALVKSVLAHAIKKGDARVLKFLVENAGKFGMQHSGLPGVVIVDNIRGMTDEQAEAAYKNLVRGPH